MNKKIEKVEKKIEKNEEKILIQPIKKPTKLKKIEDVKVEEQPKEDFFKPERQVQKVIKQSSQLKSNQ